MNFEPDPTLDAFRTDVRTFIDAKLRELGTCEVHGPPTNEHRATLQAWARALNEKSWAVPHWPLEWGGTEWSPLWRKTFEEEMMLKGAPLLDPIGIGFVGPVVYTFGSAEQKKRYLPRIRNSIDFWCQGFSEPQAGSDVTSVRTAAVRSGDHFIVNGQKIWTSNAHNADMMFALVRIATPTSRRQPGLSFLLIDMRSPGVTVRPIVTIDGQHRLNEVFLSDVRVPVENLVGEEGKGWIYARFVLSNERTIVAGLPLLRLQLFALKRMLITTQSRGRSLDQNPVLRSRLSRLEIEFEALEFMELRILKARSETTSQLLAPMLKVRGTELQQRVLEVLFEVLGDDVLRWPGSTHPVHGAHSHADALQYSRMITIGYLFGRSATIAGGTSEIQRNLIAGMSLEL
jgi:alkylation response protein AidB-like acyl-CoA dehydrogenase